MRQFHLKKVRVIIALIFFLSLIFLFLDFRKLLPGEFYDTVTFLQFIPSLLKFISVAGLTASGFIFILILTSLFGRVYCSAICPLGILQDCILWIRKKFDRKSRYHFSTPLNYLRYSFLVLPVITYLAGTILLVTLLDPFSNFGRIISDFLQPVYILINNTGAVVLEKMNVFFLYPEGISYGRWLTYLFPLFILVLIIWMSLKWGRLYCNAICPVGTLLGLMSRISVFRIKIRTDLCTQCGKCSLVCKANCINIKDQEVDLSRCVGCFNCISSCPEGGIKYTLSDRLKSQTGDYPPDPSRRKILVSAGLLLLGLAGVRKSIKASAIIENAILKSRFNDDHNAKPDSSRNDLSGSNHGVRHGQGGRSGFKHRYRRDSVPGNKQGHIWKDTFNSDPEKISVFPEKIPHNKFPTRIKPEKHYTVTPPGSLGIEHFTGTCTACHLCISACPTRVLQPSILEYGISGIMQPYMDYETNYCNFDCIICSEVCPTGAILSLTEEAKKTLQIGKVNLILENCVVRTDHTACGSCSEHCPTQAVHMVPYIGELTIPEIRPEICVGCGACEHACPTRPFRAIYVDGHYIHETALLPEEEELEEGALEEEFPF